MRNGAKNNNIYGLIVGKLEKIGRGEPVENLEESLSKSFLLFTGGYQPNFYPSSDYGAEIIRDLSAYSLLFSRRKKVDIAGGEREITMEDEALKSLFLAKNLASGLVLPLFRKKNDLSNHIFNDIYNLSLAYLDSVVDGIADEYIGKEDAFEAKLNAVNIAKEGMRTKEAYNNYGLGEETNNSLQRLERRLAHVSERHMRSFEAVATSTKKVYKKKELIAKLKEEVTSINEFGVMEYRPSVIFPIAHGGNELGIALSNAYEDKGHFPITYPLMFSIKTRKHRQPWIEHDLEFLSRNFQDQDFLLTEDWVTTGNTLRGIVVRLEDKFPREIRIATLKRDPVKSRASLLEKYRYYIGLWAEYQGTKTDSINDLKNP